VLCALRRAGRDFVAARRLEEPVGAALGADEDQGAAAVVATQLLDQVVELGAGRAHMEETMLDVGCLVVAAPVGVATRVAGEGGVDLAGGPSQRRGEEEG